MMTCDKCAVELTPLKTYEDRQFPTMVVHEGRCPNCGEAFKWLAKHPKWILSEDERKQERGVS